MRATMDVLAQSGVTAAHVTRGAAPQRRTPCVGAHAQQQAAVTRSGGRATAAALPVRHAAAVTASLWDIRHTGRVR